VGNGGNAASNAGGSAGSHAPPPAPSALSQAPVPPVVVVSAEAVPSGTATASLPSAVVPERFLMLLLLPPLEAEGARNKCATIRQRDATITKCWIVVMDCAVRVARQS